MARYRVLSHTADTGIEASAPTLSELVELLAFGMFDLMFDLESLDPVESFTVSVEASSIDDLVVDILSELLYRSEAEEVVPCAFAAAIRDMTSVSVRTEGVPLEHAELRGPPIKAVTYHQLAVTRSNGQWDGRVIFDV